MPMVLSVVDPAEALEALLILTRKLTQNLPLEEALKSVTDTVLRLLPGNHASVRVLDEQGVELLAAARSGSGAHRRPRALRPGEGIGGWVVQHGELVRINHADRDPRFVKLPAQGFFIRSILAVPLQSGGKTIGVLTTSSPKPESFGPETEDLARLIANCAVPAIEKARLERLAITDPLTRAFNHRYLQPRLQEEMSRANRDDQPLSMLLLDLDHFKSVNDTHGHQAGDRVLRVFAELVRSGVRGYNVLIRRGGEEFVLLLPGTPLHAAMVVAERVRKTVGRQRIEVAPGLRITQTVSIGVACWNGTESAEEFEQRADAAMYEAKRAGRNRLAVASTTTAEA